MGAKLIHLRLILQGETIGCRGRDIGKKLMAILDRTPGLVSLPQRNVTRRQNEMAEEPSGHAPGCPLSPFDGGLIVA